MGEQVTTPSSGTVLIVDDSATQAEMLKMILESQGYDVVAMTNGRDALAAATAMAPPPILVITDVVMPEMNGYELCRELKNHDELGAVPVILLTSLSDPDDIIRGLECGADNFVTKPYEAEYLLARVRYLLLNRVFADEDKFQLGVNVLFSGNRYFITADRQQILHLLLSTYEGAVQKNTELLRAQEELRSLNERLEDLVAERTASLQAEINQRRETEIALRRANDERDALLVSERAAKADLIHASRLKDEFLATLSHELRSPLNVIMGYAEILTHADYDPTLVQSALPAILRNARLQTKLVNDLLDVSRIVSGNFNLMPQDVDMADILRSVVQSQQVAADAKQITLHAQLSPYAEMVRGDGARLQQIAWNLIANAVKFTPEHGHVYINLSRRDRSVQLTVADTGCGIEPEFLPHVFERFRQEDASTTRRFGGLGLGLAIVRHLVELHGGDVSVTSPGRGHGATFQITLPMAQRASAPAKPWTAAPGTRTALNAAAGGAAAASVNGANGAATAAAEALLHAAPRSEPRAVAVAASVQRPLADLSLLVVDDSDDIRMLVASILRRAGADVRTAADAAEGMQRLEEGTPDLMICDIGMPGEDGLAFMRRVRRLPGPLGRLRAVALTAYVGEDERRESLAAGFHLHITKPVEPHRLVSSVVGLLANEAPASRGQAGEAQPEMGG